MFCPVCRSEYADDWKVCPKDAASLLRSQFIGKYRIDQLLGIGGMGAVFKAYNPDTQSSVAVKVMHGGAQANEQARQRFQREAAAVAALRTRHVVSIYDFGADVDGTLYLVMEYLAGHSMRAEITTMPHTMALPRANFLVDQTLRGLGAAHRAGIVHRDLKPENLYVAETDDGEVVKVLDFGIARVSRGDTPNLTHSGALMGTPAYMAPEQVAGNRGQVGRHSDVYAVGVILYEILTGMSPFHAETLSEVLSKILARQFTPLAQVRPDLPVAVSQLVDRALADDPAQRFGAADALREAWAAVWAQLPVELRNAPVPPFQPRDEAAQIGSAPGAALVTDVPSAPTEMQARHAAPSKPSQPGFAPTAAVSSPGRSTPAATTPIRGQVESPAPVPTELVPRRRGGLWIALALIALVGVVVAVFFATRGHDNDATARATVIDAAARPTAKPIDAGAVAVRTPDAARADAAPAVPADMAAFAGGTFQMGDDAEAAKKYPGAKPAHPVTVAAFYLDKTEHADADGLPQVGMSWDDADAACRAAGKRLPTEAEWEMAARSAPLDPKGANLIEAHHKGPVAVGTSHGDCTPDGVCDLLGNVMEWTAEKVVRGASYSAAANSWYGTVHARVPSPDGKGDKELGYRCAQDAPKGN